MDEESVDAGRVAEGDERTRPVHSGPETVGPEQSRWRALLIGVVAFFAFVGFVLAAVALVYVVDTATKIRSTQITGTPLGKKIEQSTSDTATTLALFQDCLDPEGVCGKASAENQARALKQVRVDMITATACADQPGTQTRAEIEACVGRGGP